MGQTNVRMAGPALVATGPTTVYTCPATTKATVKFLTLMNPSGSAVNFTLSIGADAAATRVLGSLAIAAGIFYSQWVMWVLSAAEVIQLSAGTNNILVVTIDGVESTP